MTTHTENTENTENTTTPTNTERETLAVGPPPVLTPTTHHTLAIICDPDAPTLLLRETIASLITTYSVERVYVDLVTLPGLHVAAAVVDAGITYEHLDFGQVNHPTGKIVVPAADKPITSAHFAHFSLLSAGTHTVDLKKITSLDANVVLIPSATVNGLVDFSMDTVVGEVLAQYEEAGHDVMIIVPPERGLKPIYAPREGDKSEEHTPTVDRYERLTVLVHNE